MHYHELRTGALCLQITDGQPAALTMGGSRALDALRFVVRDQYWRSVNLRLAEVSHAGEDRAEFRLISAAQGFDFEVCLLLEMTADNTISVESSLFAKHDMLTNRAGLVLLHPAHLAGTAVQLRHRNDEWDSARFPDYPENARIFRNVAGLSHAFSPDWMISIDLHGDEFETEDQRLWTDPSFKTYSRSLDSPFPYVIPAGSRTEQKALLTVRPSQRDFRAFAMRNRSAEQIPIPGIGLFLPPGPTNATEEQWERIAGLQPDHLLLEFDGIKTPPIPPSEAANIPIAWLFSCQETKGPPATDKYGTPFAMLVEGADRQDTVALRQSTSELGAATRTFLPALLSQDINWKPDFISWSVSPCVHETDDELVMDSLSMIPLMVETGREAFEGAEIWLGPVSLRPRFRPLARGRDIPPLSEDSEPDDIDPRQWEIFSAAYAMGFVAAAAISGTKRLSLFEPFGERGLVDADGRLSPAYHMLSRLMRHHGDPVSMSLSHITKHHAVLASGETGKICLWIANLGPWPHELKQLPPGTPLASLHADGWKRKTAVGTFILDGYSVVEFQLTDFATAESITTKLTSESVPKDR